MPLFRATIKRVEYVEAEFEADSFEDAQQMAAAGDCGDGQWTDATGGRGLGDDDVEVLDVEQIEDEDEDEDEQEDSDATE